MRTFYMVSFAKEYRICTNMEGFVQYLYATKGLGISYTLFDMGLLVIVTHDEIAPPFILFG